MVFSQSTWHRPERQKFYKNRCLRTFYSYDCFNNKEAWENEWLENLDSVNLKKVDGCYLDF